MKLYEYFIDADESYEDWMCASIFSTELLSKEEFEEVVKKAIEAEGEFADWSSVANWIVENDDRFFTPKKGHSAIVKYDLEDNGDIFGGVY